MQVRSHVLEAYLPRKLANFTGRAERALLAGEATVRVPRTHAGDEGKLKGMHEHLVKAAQTLGSDQAFTKHVVEQTVAAVSGHLARRRPLHATGVVGAACPAPPLPRGRGG